MVDQFDSFVDRFKTISDVDNIILYESCADGDLDELIDWWDGNENGKKHKAALELKDKEGRSLLHVAAFYGQLAIVEVL